MTRKHTVSGIIISALLIMLMSHAYAQSELDVSEIVKAQKSFNPDGFKSYGKYRWDNPLCDDYNHRVGRCVGLYQDNNLSIYPVKDAMPDGDYGHAIIHGRVNLSKEDIEYGEKNKWIGSTKYGEVYTIEAGYIFLPRSSFPPHILFSRECRSIRVKLIDETVKIVEKVLEGSKPTGEIIVEYPLGYDHWHSRDPYLIESMCFVESRSYKGNYQPYLGPLKLLGEKTESKTAWKIVTRDDAVVLSITGNITHGERQRFVFRKKNCDQVIHIFSIYSEEPANFEELVGTVFSIEFNGEKIGTELIAAKEAMSGHLLMFNLGGYDKDVLLSTPE